MLSGFLITGLLLAEWRAGGRIPLRRFWVRRARRLLPAMLLVLTTVAVAERVLAAPEGMPLVRGDILATLFYVANLHSIFAGHSYFASFAAPSPLLHTWSLAIEEQFYLVWPLVAAWALTRRRSPRLLLLSGCLDRGSRPAPVAGGVRRPIVGPDPGDDYDQTGFGQQIRQAGECRRPAVSLHVVPQLVEPQHSMSRDAVL